MNSNASAAQAKNIAIQNQPNATAPNAKLPILGLPKFYGNYDKWTEFSETIIVLVHNNKRLDDIQKFYNLLDTLQGDAKRVLESCKATQNNYSIAWELLKERFENKSAKTQTHLKILKKFVDKLQKHKRALKRLGKPTETWDGMIIFIMSLCIQTIIQKTYYKSVIRH